MCFAKVPKTLLLFVFEVVVLSEVLRLALFIQSVHDDLSAIIEKTFVAVFKPTSITCAVRGLIMFKLFDIITIVIVH